MGSTVSYLQLWFEYSFGKDSHFPLVLTMDDSLKVAEGCCLEVTNGIVASPCFYIYGYHINTQKRIT